MNTLDKATAIRKFKELEKAVQEGAGNGSGGGFSSKAYRVRLSDFEEGWSGGSVWLTRVGNSVYLMADSLSVVENTWGNTVTGIPEGFRAVVQQIGLGVMASDTSESGSELVSGVILNDTFAIGTNGKSSSTVQVTMVYLTNDPEPGDVFLLP